MPADPVRIAVVGTGGIGNYHLELWRGVPGATVVGLHDIQPSVAQAAAQRHGIERVYPTLAEAVGDPRIDLVDVCAPNAFHKAAVLAALAAGKHCLCEKPLAPTAADIDAMIAARDRSGHLLMTTQHLRFEAPSIALKRMVAAGDLGDVYYTRAWWLRRCMAPVTAGLLSSDQACRGPGLDLGVHMLDLALHLLDYPQPVSVTALTSDRLVRQCAAANEWGPYDPSAFEVEDFLAGFIRFTDGRALSLEASWLLHMSENELRGLWLYGTAGGLQWPQLTRAHLAHDLPVDSRPARRLESNGHQAAFSALIRAIRNGEPSPVPPEQSRTVARILDALYASAESGREVALA